MTEIDFTSSLPAPEPVQIDLSPLGKKALYYAQREIPVFPLIAKRPLTENGFKDATVHAPSVIQWWSIWPDANIGTPTGVCTDAVTERQSTHPFDVLDVDPKHDGPVSLARLEDAHGPLPRTLRQTTGSGGQHLFFHADGALRNSAGALGPGLDIRATGGYVVLPPSIHPHTKQAYRWALNDTGQSRDLARLLAPMPTWLRDVLMHSTRAPRQFDEHAGPVSEGSRNDELFRRGCSLRHAGFTVEDIADALSVFNARHCRPPLNEPEIETIAESCGRYERRQPPVADVPRIIVSRNGREVVR